MSRLNLTNLETVACIARLGTFGAASEHLHASQPAITARVREIERSLGIVFFQRRGRRMQLTAEGRRFIQQVEPLVAGIEQAVAGHSDRSVAAGVVRIGVGAVTMMSWFSAFVGELKQRMPGVHYEVEVEMTAAMIDRLLSGKLDMAIVGGSVRLPRLRSHELEPSQMEWVRSARIPLPKGRRTSNADILNGVPLWLVPRSSVVFPRAVATARRHGARLHNLNTCGSIGGLSELIDQGGGVGIVATELARDRIASGALVRMKEMEREQLGFTLLYHEDDCQPVIREIARLIVERDRRR